MHFDTAVNWLDGTNHFMNIENEEVVRLRRLMHESILKVEKENLETVQKKLCNQEETENKVIYKNNDSKQSLKHQSGSFSRSLKARPASFRRIKQQETNFPKVKAASSEEPTSTNCANVCKKSRPLCQNSYIHFLNHFQSSFLSSKPSRNLQPYNSNEKYTACAIPLAPPCRKKEIIDFEKEFASDKKPACVPNNVAYHVISENIPKKLSIQALPSISISGRKHSSGKNYRIEEISEKNHAAGDCFKTTVLPAVSDEVRHRLSNINLNSIQMHKGSGSEEKNKESSPLRLKKSVFTQRSQSDESLPKQPDKSLLKEIVKEALQEFQQEYPHEFIQLSDDKNFSTHHNEQTLTSPENDCELDSFIGNADSLVNDVATMVSSNIFMRSTFTQTTSSDRHHMPFNQIDVKNLIQEVFLEMQENSSLKFNQNIDEPNNVFQIEKMHRNIQVDLKHDERNQKVLNYSSKAVQVSYKSENEMLDIAKSSKTSDIRESFTGDHFNVISNSTIMKNNETPECHGEIINGAASTEIPSKLESVLNFVYNRFCRETGELSLSTEKVISNNNSPSVRTREVSIQFNPVSTSTKSTATSEIALIDASNQCDAILPQQVQKDTRHASVQVLLEPEIVLPVPIQEKVDTSVQWERPVSAFRDSCVQTMDLLNPSENSANTSVSSTPVSDSIFLDDMLSDGEVFLPWNLRLLSLADKNATQDSYNATETNDKEKDYSLSEGEVPPKYLQQLNFAQSPSCDSNSEAYTDPAGYLQNTSTPTQKTHFMSSPEAESLSRISHGRCCHCRTSSSSLSEGEVKGPSASISEGEIPSGLLRQRSTGQHASAAPSLSTISDVPPRESGTVLGDVIDSQILGESSYLQENSRQSGLDFSEGEVIGRSQMPYQSTPYPSFLHTVNEEN